jgi:hypothetical protein
VLGNSTQLNNARMNQKYDKFPSDTHSQERGGGFLFFWFSWVFLEVGISNFKPQENLS